MTFKVPESMYGKGPKNNPAPEKGWDTSGSHAYGDAGIRMLETSNYAPELNKQEMYSLTSFKMEKRR